MPGCCVKYCTSSGRKGQSLFRIPANISRRQTWLTLLSPKEGYYSHSDYSNLRICELHFSESQFIVVGNKMKLKNYAVPDLLQSAFRNKEIMANQVEYNSGDRTDANVPSDVNYQYTTKDKLCDLTTECETVNNKLKKLQLKYQSFKSHLEKVFSPDQLSFCEHQGSLKGMSWSNDTLNKSLKLYMACGTTGYEEILKQGLPYPSVRTLQRHIQNMKFKPGLLQES